VLNLSSPELSFILLSASSLEDMMSILWAKNYQILPIQGYYQEKYENAALAFSAIDNDELRKDLIFLLNHFHQDCGIIKYKGESGSKKVFKDGSEKPLGIVLYNTDADNISYLYNGTSFSFVEQVRYWKPTCKEDLKAGMIVEYFSNKNWTKKEIKNLDIEFEDMYKLLIKYDKIRVASI
jgi:hypothetical protein